MRSQAALPAGCESTAACVEQNGGRAALCRFPGSPCLKIETAACPRVSGPWQADDVLLLGSLGAHTLLTWDGSSIPVDRTERILRAIDLGLDEWQREVPEGLFFSRRPIAMVHCDSQGDPALAQAALDHLVEELRAPVVLALTDLEQEVAVERALESEVTLVYVESHAPALLPPQLERGLVWRMLPSLDSQAAPAAWRVSDLEQRIRVERGLPGSTPLRVAAWSDSGPAFVAFMQQLRQQLRFNGGQDVEQNAASYFEQQNVDPRQRPQDQLEYVRRMLAFAPDILVVAMDDEFTGYYMRILEAEWPQNHPRPHYVLTLLNQELEQLAPIIADDDDLRQRSSGTGLFEADSVLRNRASFQARYRSRYAREPGRAQAGYDAWYATALAIYSADAGGRLDGASIATQFARLRSGPALDVDPRALGSARLYLSAQQSIDLLGTSSTLDWNPFTHIVEAELGLWCLSRDSAGTLHLQENAGPRWSTAGVTGSYTCPTD